jgi:hypothetical protein
MTPKQRSDIRRKLNVFAYAENTGNITKACRHYGISKTTYFLEGIPFPKGLLWRGING